MNIVVIDAQSGKIGKSLLEAIKKKCPDCTLTAVGANAIATQNMLKAAPDKAATGENAVIRACAKADIISGPVGIVIANSMLGEITPAMAAAAASCDAVKVLLPVNKCETVIVGTADLSLNALISAAADEIASRCAQIE